MERMLSVRPVTDDDCRLLWEWVNEPGVRSFAFQSHFIPWEEHRAWFAAKRVDPCWVMFIVLDEIRRPVGQVRFEPQDQDGAATEVAISIGREWRGRGYGTEAIRLACEAYRRMGQAARVVACIKPENVASLRIFEKAGFVLQGRQYVRGHDAVCMSFELKNRPAPSKR